MSDAPDNENSNINNEKIYVWGLASNNQDCTKGGTVDVQMIEGIASVHCGGRITCAVSSKNKLWTWGYDGSRCFGFSVPGISPIPRMISDIEVKEVFCGLDHVAVIGGNGKLYTYGTGTFFRLGQGGTEDQHIPKQVPRINNIVITAACGGMHTSCVTRDGLLWTWGYGKFGALGHGDSQNQEFPKVVPSIKDVLSVANGRDHTLILTKSGDVFSCGYGGSGALGHGNTCNKLYPEKIPTLSQVKSIGAGAYYSAALTHSGNVYTWGTNEDGVLGQSGIVGVQSKPARISSLEKITNISCGYYHMAAINFRGEVFIWGNGDYGKLCTNDTKSSDTPQRVAALFGVGVHKVYCSMAQTTVWVNLERFLSEIESRSELFEFITWAVSQGSSHIDLAKSGLAFFLARPKHDLTSCDSSGRTFLHHASQFGNSPFVKMLLQNHKGSVDVNSQDTLGMTALHCSLKNGHLDTARVLVENGAKLDVTDKNGHTPIHWISSENLLFEFKQIAGIHDVFLSYSTFQTSAAFTRRLFTSLENSQISVWMDEKKLKPGVDWAEEIKKAVPQCKGFIFVVSTKSVESDTCKLEFQIAVKEKKKIFPVILEQADLTKPPWNSLAQHQWVNFTQGSYDQNVGKLISGIKEFLTDVHDTSVEKADMQVTQQVTHQSDSLETLLKKLPIIQGHPPPMNFSKKRKNMEPSEGSVWFIHELGGNEFLDRMLLGARSAVQQLNLHFDVHCAKGNRENMIGIIGKAITSKSRVIILNHGGNVLIPSIDLATSFGIKILTIDLKVPNPLVTEIQQDDFALAFKLCRQMIEDTDGNSNVIYLSAPHLAFLPLQKRHRVWEDYKWSYPGLNEIARYGTINMTVAETCKKDTVEFLQKEYLGTSSANFSLSSSLQNTANTVILAMWDQWAIGAIDALFSLKVNRNFSVYSIDISNQVINYMNLPESPWRYTVAVDPMLIGNFSVRCSFAWMNHGIDLGKYLLIEPTLISQDFVTSRNITNMDQLVNELPSLQEQSLFVNYPFLQKQTLGSSTIPKNLTLASSGSNSDKVNNNNDDNNDKDDDNDDNDDDNDEGDMDIDSNTPITQQPISEKKSYRSTVQQRQPLQRQQQRYPTATNFFSRIPFC